MDTEMLLSHLTALLRPRYSAGVLNRPQKTLGSALHNYEKRSDLGAEGSTPAHLKAVRL